MTTPNFAAHSSKIPTEEKWDHSIENGIRKTLIGLAVGVVPALFARRAAARMGMLFLCTGVGVGIAYSEARYLFDYDIAFDRRHLVKVEWLPNFGGAATAAERGDKQ